MVKQRRTYMTYTDAELKRLKKLPEDSPEAKSIIKRAKARGIKQKNYMTEAHLKKLHPSMRYW